VLYAGDVANVPSSAEAQARDLEKLLSAFEAIERAAGSSAPTCRFVRGNCDNFESVSEFYMKEEEEFEGIRIVPFEDILITPFGTFREVSEARIAEDLKRIDGKGAIVLAHQPPFGAGDDIGGGVHVGSKAVREWIEKEKPAYWLCGHVHEGAGESEIGETKVINAAQGFYEITNDELRMTN
jgi:Icc-related predicted phosphoesterase